MLATLRQEKFLRLFLQHQLQIEAYVRSLVPNRADAEELVQDVAAVLWRKFDDAGPVAPVAGEQRGEPAYVATLVNVTNCRWDKARSTADLQRQAALRAGESLHLLEGIAEITSALPGGGVATIQLEGPLAMMLTSEGMPSLQYGRMTGL